MADDRLTPNPAMSDKDAVSDLEGGFLVGGGRFSLLRELGRGGMGVVWLAHDERLAASVALKFLPRAVRDNPTCLNDLRQETRKSRMLSHPNIIRIYDLYEAPDEAAFISMEYVEGPSLWLLRSRQPQGCFSWDYLAPVVKQLCAALDYAHGEHVIHRDLKSANMLLDDRQRLRLADFGIAARALNSPTRDTGVYLTSGTLSFMSPQQIDGGVPCVSDDMYALGATLYELLSGRPPFYQNDIAYQARHVLPTPLSERLADLEIDNEVPESVAALIMACLSKDPGKRPASARAVAQWLGMTDSAAASAAPFVPVVVPLIGAAAESGPASAASPSVKQNIDPVAPPRAFDAPSRRLIGILAGAVGVGLAGWLAYSQLMPRELVLPPPDTDQTNALDSSASNAAQPVVAPSSTSVASGRDLNGTSISVELGVINREQGLRQLTGIEDGVTVPVNMAGKDCRLLASGPRPRCYFQILPDSKSTNLMNARIEVEYFANLPGVMQLQFDGVAPKQTPHYTAGGKINFDAEAKWQTANFHVRKARFGSGQKGGADFRLTTSSPELYIHSVTVYFGE